MLHFELFRNLYHDSIISVTMIEIYKAVKVANYIGGGVCAPWHHPGPVTPCGHEWGPLTVYYSSL